MVFKYEATLMCCRLHIFGLQHSRVEEFQANHHLLMRQLLQDPPCPHVGVWDVDWQPQEQPGAAPACSLRDSLANFFQILYYTFFIILYCIILYYIILYYNILYYVILYYIRSELDQQD